jgi:hypothetical protein
MKAATTTIINLAMGMCIIHLLAAFLAFAPDPAQAQDSGILEPADKYGREELTQMLAPIALYPDALLSQVLMASTYPIEVIEADRWVRKNPDLNGDSLDDALLEQDWDPSVKAMCHFPSILALMSERIAETTKIGNAFLAQKDEVMSMVQELRAKAYAQGNLATTSEQKVIVEKETIIIEPADPSIIYVPYYDPFYIYGPWWYPAYPPYYWGPSRVGIGIGISYWPSFYFGSAFGFWSYFDWHQHYVYIDVHRRPKYVRHDRWVTKPGRWNHSPGHRRGVAYRDKSTARKYGQYPPRPRKFKPETRGFPESSREQVRDRIRQNENRTSVERNRRQDTWTRINRATEEAQRVERDLKMQQRARQERIRIKPDRQEAQGVERGPQMRQQAGQKSETRERVELQQQQRRSDNVFNRVEDGTRERKSSERGRVSREGRSSYSLDRGPSGGNNRGGRSERNRDKR